MRQPAGIAAKERCQKKAAPALERRQAPFGGGWQGLAFALICSRYSSSARFTSWIATPALTARLTMSFVPVAARKHHDQIGFGFVENPLIAQRRR
jgi:hypothetical protein